LEECFDIKNKKILDIGCGPGEYAVALAKMHPLKVVCIDFSEDMLAKAKQLAEENKVTDICRFINADFLRYVFEEKFDICLAIGFFDYTEDPLAVLKKIRDLCQEKIIVSFPAKWRLRNILRIIRLKILKCPVYFYTVQQIEDLLIKSSFNNFKIKTIDRDYFVVAK
jgi:ubiquinone/menaquinone biosynthesis C-methylase UbiE